MSQSLADDFPIDPLVTSGDELADILNRFEQAVNSNNSGAAAPPSTSTGMFWLDTSGASPVLKIRNATNSGWISLMTMDAAGGGVSSLFADGAAGAPSMAFVSEPGLGWYRNAAGQMSFAQGGAQRFAFTAGQLLGPAGTLAAPAFSFLSETGLGLYRSGAGIMSMAVGGSRTFQFTGGAAGNSLSLLQGAAANWWSGIVLQSKGTGQNSLTGQQNGITHWTVVPGVGGAADDFAIGLYNDAGTYVFDALYIVRSTGNANFARGLTVGTFSSAGGAAGAGHYYLVNGSTVTVADFGVGVLSGVGDSVGINVPNNSGVLSFGVNGASRILIEQYRVLLYHNRVDIGTPDLRITGIATTGSAPNLFQDPSQGYVYRSTSSLRYKKDIVDVTPQDCAAIYGLRPITYRSKSEVDDPTRVFFGLIAEEVATVEPRLVQWTYLPEDYVENDQGDRVLKDDAQQVPDGVQYDRLVVLLTAEMNRMNARVSALENA